MTWSLWTASRRVVLLPILVLVHLISNANATTVQFVATNLSDVTPGEDLWRYDYIVTGHSFLASEFLMCISIPCFTALSQRKSRRAPIGT